MRLGGERLAAWRPPACSRNEPQSSPAPSPPPPQSLPRKLEIWVLRWSRPVLHGWHLPHQTEHICELDSWITRLELQAYVVREGFLNKIVSPQNWKRSLWQQQSLRWRWGREMSQERERAARSCQASGAAGGIRMLSRMHTGVIGFMPGSDMVRFTTCPTPWL